MAIYLDSNILIFAFANQDQKGEKSRELLERIVRGQIAAMTSNLTFDEMFYKINKLAGREKAILHTKDALGIRNLVFLDVNMDVVRYAHELLEKYNLGPRDAIHVASAIINHASSIITDDKDFSGVTEIKWERLIVQCKN